MLLSGENPCCFQKVYIEIKRRIGCGKGIADFRASLPVPTPNTTQTPLTAVLSQRDIMERNESQNWQRSERELSKKEFDEGTPVKQ